MKEKKVHAKLHFGRNFFLTVENRDALATQSRSASWRFVDPDWTTTFSWQTKDPIAGRDASHPRPNLRAPHLFQHIGTWPQRTPQPFRSAFFLDTSDALLKGLRFFTAFRPLPPTELKVLERPSPKTQAFFNNEKLMTANALLITIAVMLAIGFFLMGELKFFIPFKVVIWRA